MRNKNHNELLVNKEELRRISLLDILEEYSKKNTRGLNHEIMSVGKFGLRHRSEIYDHELSSTINNYKIIKKDTLTIGMGSTQIDIGILEEDRQYLVSPAYTTFNIRNVEINYLKYLLQKHNKKISNLYLITGARQGKSINKKGLLSHEFYFPSPTNQQKIGSFLSALDRLIDLQKETIDSYKSLKKGYLQKMFPADGADVPEIRFKGYTDAWEKFKISEMFRVTRGEVLATKLVKRKKTEDTPYPVYSSQTKDKGLLGFYKEYLYEDAITWTTDGANAGTVAYREGKFYCTNVCGVLLSDKVRTNQMISEALNKVTKSFVSYVGNPKLMNNVMADIILTLPKEPEEQQKIGRTLESLDSLITLHQRKLEQYEKLKSGYLQRLFTD